MIALALKIAAVVVILAWVGAALVVWVVGGIHRIAIEEDREERGPHGEG
jgi:hypothetical protein